ncbi:unnamed protein product [Schistosoma intercalatum]|nr:unnamed protein product [Schistosoma intercalatum]
MITRELLFDKVTHNHIELIEYIYSFFLFLFFLFCLIFHSPLTNGLDLSHSCYNLFISNETTYPSFIHHIHLYNWKEIIF